MAVQEVIALNLGFQALVCKLWPAAMQRGLNIAIHFRRVHKLKGDVIRAIRDYYGSLQVAGPENAAIPRDGSRPIRELEISNGVSRGQCRYLSLASSNRARTRQ